MRIMVEYFKIKSGQKIAIVADGMGGHRAGDVASEITIMKLKEIWEETNGIETAEQAENWFKENINHVNIICLTMLKIM